MTEKRIYPPIHPGRVLELEFLEPLELSPYGLAKSVGVDPPRIYKIVKGERGITGDTALRFARYFGTSPEFWINLQSRYELEMARYQAEERIEEEVRPRALA
jgi:addiction module HigA family antidote